MITELLAVITIFLILRGGMLLAESGESVEDLRQLESSDVALEDVTKIDLDDQNSAFLPIFSVGLGVWLITLGYRLSSQGHRYRIETAAFRWEDLFSRLRYRCTVHGVDHEATTESRTRQDWDGVEREYFVCFDSYRYNISVGPDPRIRTSGFHEVKRKHRSIH